MKIKSPIFRPASFLRSVSVSACLILCVMFTGCGKPCINPGIKDRHKRVQQYLQRLVLGNNIPGLQYIVSRKGRILDRFAVGFADLRQKRLMTPQTPMHVFSITKVITAVAVLQLAERGRLQLDRPLSRYGVHTAAFTAVTPRQLLTHTGGVPNPMLGNFFIHWRKDADAFRRDRLLTTVLDETKPIDIPEGESPPIAYSNLGYALLGRLIETVAGTRYETYVRRRILRPLGINTAQAHFNFPDDDRAAKPYIRGTNFMLNMAVKKGLKGSAVSKVNGWNVMSRPFRINFPAHGGLVTTSSALNTFLTDLTGGRSRLLGESYRQTLFRQQVRRDDRRVAAAWFIKDVDGHKTYYHTGGGIGFVSSLRYYPDSGTVSVLLINMSDTSTLKIVDTLDRQYLPE